MIGASVVGACAAAQQRPNAPAPEYEPPLMYDWGGGGVGAVTGQPGEALPPAMNLANADSDSADDSHPGTAGMAGAADVASQASVAGAGPSAPRVPMKPKGSVQR
ncbi:MAG TPA: hypothetical protein VIV60_04695 [Polyangiaceae bacterium]